MTDKKSPNASYSVYFLPVAKKELDALPPDIQKQLMPIIRSLKDPIQVAAIKLKDREDTYRLRVGDYRVLFKIYTSEKIVVIVKVSHRKKVYR